VQGARGFNRISPKALLLVQPVVVSGIREGPTPGIRIVEYIWAVAWDALPPELKMCLSIPSKPWNATSGSGTAIFQLYDDGWRITDMQ
jgi:hypothetical protein